MRLEIEQSENEVEWRRDKVLQLRCRGYSHREIAIIMKLNVGTIKRDLVMLREQSKENLKKYIDEKLPEEYKKCLIGLNSMLKESWTLSGKAQNKREKLHALNLAKECYAMRLDLLTNATAIVDAIRFIQQQQPYKLNNVNDNRVEYQQEKKRFQDVPSKVDAEDETVKKIF